MLGPKKSKISYKAQCCALNMLKIWLPRDVGEFVGVGRVLCLVELYG